MKIVYDFAFIYHELQRRIFIDKKISDLKKKYDNKDCIGVGIIGLGNWGRQYVDLLDRHPGYKIYSIFDVDGQICERLGEKYNVKTETPEEMINNSDIDTVFILLPNHLHYEYTEKCLFNRKNVFIEKPITNDSESAFKLEKLSQDTGKKIYVGHSMKFGKGFQKLKEIIESKTIGDIHQIYCVRSLSGIHNCKNDTWRSNPNLAPILPMTQLGIHLIDLCNYLFDDLEVLSAHQTIRGNLTESVSCILCNDNLSINLMTSYNTINTLEFVVFGSKGKIVLNDKKLNLYLLGTSEKTIINHIDFDDPLVDELCDYYDWRVFNIAPKNVLSRAVRNVSMLEEIQRLVSINSIN